MHFVIVKLNPFDAKKRKISDGVKLKHLEIIYEMFPNKCAN